MNNSSESRILNDLNEDQSSWENALLQMLRVPSYKKFFEVTSPYQPIVVKKDLTVTDQSKIANCHSNVKDAVDKGLGQHIWGWEIRNEFLFQEFGRGICQMVSHSNLLRPNGSFINITANPSPYMIFLRDDKRMYDFINGVGYNNRLIFGDDFQPEDKTRSNPRNKVFFESGGEMDRDLFYEKFKEIGGGNLAAIYNSVPKNLSQNDQAKWLALKIAPF